MEIFHDEEGKQRENLGPQPLVGASPEAIQYHYDVGNDFFRLWLDKSMTYSAAMWSPNIQSLEEAQMQKRAYHIQASRAAGKSKVLDIGCGWGSCLVDLVERYAVDSAVGLTLSSAQLDWINQQMQPRVEVRT